MGASMSLRVDNWPAKLNEAVEAHQAMPFAWGSSDCVCFASDCAKAITGVDFLAEFRGYTTEDEALALIKREGGLEAGLDKALTCLKAERCALPLLRRGDIVLLAMDDKTLAGVWLGGFALAPFPDKGLCRIPKQFIKAGWRIA